MKGMRDKRHCEVGNQWNFRSCEVVIHVTLSSSSLTVHLANDSNMMCSLEHLRSLWNNKLSSNLAQVFGGHTEKLNRFMVTIDQSHLAASMVVITHSTQYYILSSPNRPQNPANPTSNTNLQKPLKNEWQYSNSTKQPWSHFYNKTASHAVIQYLSPQRENQDSRQPQSYGLLCHPQNGCHLCANTVQNMHQQELLNMGAIIVLLLQRCLGVVQGMFHEVTDIHAVNIELNCLAAC